VRPKLCLLVCDGFGLLGCSRIDVLVTWGAQGLVLWLGERRDNREKELRYLYFSRGGLGDK
jgi:hypothetical protein